MGVLLLDVVEFVMVVLVCGLDMLNCDCHELGKACCDQNPCEFVGGGDVKSVCKCNWLLCGEDCCATYTGGTSDDEVTTGLFSFDWFSTEKNVKDSH